MIYKDIKVKSKVLPYSLSSVGPGADPGIQAVSPQVTFQVIPGGRLPVLSARPVVMHFPSQRTSLSFDQYQVILLGDRVT